MGFDGKCVENYESAILLCENQKYNSCANRIYYSIYNLMLSKITDMKKYDDLKFFLGGNTTSHKLTTEYFIDHLIKNRLKKEDYDKMWESITALKTARHTADYSDTNITEKKAKSLVRHGDRIREIINKVK